MRSKTIVGIDAGYGTFKAAHAEATDLTTRPEVLRRFSGAGPAEKLMGAYSQDEVIVVKGVPYVGLRSADEFSSTIKSTAHGYIRRDEYDVNMRLMLGQLDYRSIDILVLGLPFSQTSKEKTDDQRFLEERYKGQIELAGGRSVRVGAVETMAQPMGALNAILATNSGTFPRSDEGALVLDIGRCTTDWVLVRKGVVWTQLSGSLRVGSTAVLSRMRDILQRTYAYGYDIESLEDRMYESNYVLDTGSTEIKLDQLFREASQEFAQTICNGILEVFSREDNDRVRLSQVYVVGGGALLYRASISSLLKQFFSTKHVLFPEDPVNAVANGFYIKGCQSVLLGAAA